MNQRPWRDKGQKGDRCTHPRLKDEARYVREGAALALSRIGRAAVPTLIESLRDKDRNIRRWAAWTLGKIKDERAARHLIGALNDEDGGVQFAAEVALAEMEE